MPEMGNPPLCIVGAGLAGLTLARGLLRRGIPTVIYEKTDHQPMTAPYGYGITLHGSTYRPLLKVLGLSPHEFRRRVAVDANVEGTGALDPKALVHKDLVSNVSFRCNKHKLQELLREGLTISSGVCEGIESSPSDGHSVHLKDGGVKRFTHVVAAEGVHSPIRSSLFPNVKPVVLPIVAFNGKRKITRATYDDIYAPVLKDRNVVETSHNGIILNVQINDLTPDTVSISWIFSRAARGQNDALYRPTRQNSEATKIPEGFFGEIEELKGLHQPFKDVFDITNLRNEKRILSWLMRTVEVDLGTLMSTARNGVCLIGDAVHAEPIIAGEGGNVAIKDGLALAAHIANGGISSMADFYKQQHPDWIAGVQRSKQALAAIYATERSSL